jgi:hypothetical protein
MVRGGLMLLAGAGILTGVSLVARRIDALPLLRQAGGAVVEAFAALLPRLLELALLLGLVLLVPVALLLLVGGVVRIARGLRRGARR